MKLKILKVNFVIFVIVFRVSLFGAGTAAAPPLMLFLLFVTTSDALLSFHPTFCSCHLFLFLLYRSSLNLSDEKGWWWRGYPCPFWRCIWFTIMLLLLVLFFTIAINSSVVFVAVYEGTIRRCRRCACRRPRSPPSWRVAINMLLITSALGSCPISEKMHYDVVV